jgi:hypothetical protein
LLCVSPLLRWCRHACSIEPGMLRDDHVFCSCRALAPRQVQQMWHGVLHPLQHQCNRHALSATTTCCVRHRCPTSAIPAVPTSSTTCVRTLFPSVPARHSATSENTRTTRPTRVTPSAGSLHLKPSAPGAPPVSIHWMQLHAASPTAATSSHGFFSHRRLPDTAGADNSSRHSDSVFDKLPAGLSAEAAQQYGGSSRTGPSRTRWMHPACRRTQLTAETSALQKECAHQEAPIRGS